MGLWLGLLSAQVACALSILSVVVRCTDRENEAASLVELRWAGFLNKPYRRESSPWPEISDGHQHLKTPSPTITPANVSSSPTVDNKSFDSTMPRPRLSGDQIRHYAEAVESFRFKRFDSPQTIHREFQTVEANKMRGSEMRKRCTVALDHINSAKNRYTDVLPFDDNRVIMKQSSDYRLATRGYINASFVKTSESISRFIATQGPLSHTSEDFWEMILEFRCSVIVMLTRLVDNYHLQAVKCADYFQGEDGPRVFGNICIATKRIQTLDNSLILNYGYHLKQ